jgi:hypothetical protein
MTTFAVLAEQEDRAAAALRQLSPDYVAFLEDAVDAFTGSVLAFDGERMLFEGFYIHAKKMARLTLMSALRQHRVQLNLNLRQLIEATSHFAYFAHNTDFPTMWAAKNASSADLFKSNDTVTREVYRWIEQTYPAFTGDFVAYKRQLNRATAHASIISTGWMIDFEAGKYVDQFLDASSDVDCQVGLHTAGQIVTLSGYMVHHLSRDVSGFTVNDNLRQQLALLQATSDDLRARLAEVLGVPL